MYFQTKNNSKKAISNLKQYFFGLFLKFSHKECNFNDFKCLPKKNNKQIPINIKRKKIIIGTPIIFQHK